MTTSHPATRALLLAIALAAYVNAASAQLKTNDKGHLHGCYEVDRSKHGDVKVLPPCPPKAPNGTDPELKRYVETTITVMFECDKNPWIKLTPEEQKVFRSGSYVSASAAPWTLLKALNLIDNTRQDDNKHPRTNSEDKTTAYVSGLLAISYYEEFEQWQVRAESPKDLTKIIDRIAHAKGVKYILRDFYTEVLSRRAPSMAATNTQLRHLLQYDSTFDQLSSRQYHLTLTEAFGAWEITRGSKKVVVALLDSGCDVGHPDLNANLWVNPGESRDGVDNDGNGIIDDVNGAHFFPEGADGDVTDSNGHGTHVAGIMAAVGNNGIGVTGLMQEATVLCLRRGGEASSADLARRAYQYALRRGARVINNSWRIPGPLTASGDQNGVHTRGSSKTEGFVRTFAPVLRRLQAAGVINVWAAGNSGNNIDGPLLSMPSSVLTEERGFGGAVNLQLVVVNTDQNDDKADSSDYGVVETDLSAPGTEILSTAPVNGSTRFSDETGRAVFCEAGVPKRRCLVQTGYGVLTGTSQAAPVVSGAAGLCLSVLEPCHLTNDTQITYDCILSTVDKKAQLADVTRTGGRLNVRRAVECCATFCKKRPQKPQPDDKHKPKPKPDIKG